jgi:hypothetical protein
MNLKLISQQLIKGKLIEQQANLLEANQPAS